VGGTVDRSKRRYLQVFSGYIQGLKPDFIKKRILRYLLSFALYNKRPDILLVLVTACVISVLILLPKVL
jgi:hypothetical protein